MAFTLNDDDKAMLRASAYGINTAGVQSLETAVTARLNALLDSGTVSAITKNHVRSAITTEMAKGK
jgi:hypothetical protein